MNKGIVLCFAFVLTACSSSKKASPPVRPPQPLTSLDAEIVLDETKVTEGLLRFSIENKGAAAREATFEVDGKPMGRGRQLDSKFEIDVSQLTDGQHTLQATLVGEGDSRASMSATFEVENASVKVTRFSVPDFTYPGHEFTVELETEGVVKEVNADFSHLAKTFAAGDARVEVETSSKRIVRYVVPRADMVEGSKQITVAVVDPRGRKKRLNAHTFLSSGLRLALGSPKATIENIARAEGSEPSVVHPIKDDVSIITGESIEVPVVVKDPQNLSQILLQIEGFAGALVFDVERLSQAGVSGGVRVFADAETTIALPLELPQGALAKGSKGTWQGKISARTKDGKLTQNTQVRIHYGSAQSGGLKVTLLWLGKTDVDLHVIEPNQDEIYYNNMQSNSGGTLDLDSNAGCSLDNVNHENVFWQRPASGEYVVRVAFFDDCEAENAGPQSSAWKVKVEGCGVNLENSGMFSAGSDARGEAGAGVEALRFKATCKPFYVSGKAEYERVRIAGTTDFRTMRGVPFEVIADLDKSVLGKGVVRGFDGEFETQFDAPPDEGGKVHLQFQLNDDDVQVRKRAGGDFLRYGTASWVPKDNPEFEKDVRIGISKSSGGINIFTAMKRGVSFLASKNLKMSKTIAEWEKGKPSTLGTSYFDDKVDLISINSDSGNTDEFDDPVMLHELSHRVLSKFGRDDSPGGSHSGLDRVAPNLAWSEGFASYFALRMNGLPYYWDRMGESMATEWKIDELGSRPIGTADGTSKSNISEAVVRALLWDLQDEVSPAENDNVEQQEDAVLKALFGPLKGKENLARGEVGRVDLADLMSLYGCALQSTLKADVTLLLEKRFGLAWFNETGFCQ